MSKHNDAYKPPMLTNGGFNGYEVTSALQKCIRRGLERDAMFWATELWASCDKTGREYIWHRLRVIASEDVGLADNNACVQVSALYANFIRRPNERDFPLARCITFVPCSEVPHRGPRRDCDCRREIVLDSRYPHLRLILTRAEK